MAGVATSAHAGHIPLWPILYYRSPLPAAAERAGAPVDGTYRLWVLWPVFRSSDDGRGRQHVVLPLFASYRAKGDGEESVQRLSLLLGLLHSSSVSRSSLAGLATSAEERRLSVLRLFRLHTVLSPREGRTFERAHRLFPLWASETTGEGSQSRLALLDPLEQLWWLADRHEGERRWSALMKMMGHSRAASGERRWHGLWGLVSYSSDADARRLRLLFLPAIPLGRGTVVEGS